jgi:hypothetical protein
MASPSYPEFERFNPSRSPAWRWERAQSLWEQRRHFSPHFDDEETHEALRYLRACRGRRGASSQAVIARFQDIHAARLLYEGDSEARTEVEARILAGQTDAEIAWLTNIPTSTITVYEGLFFRCREHLDARDWISLQAIGTSADATSILKQLAYRGGPLALDIVLAVTRDRPLPRHLFAAAPDPELAELRVRTAVKLLLDAMIPSPRYSWKDQFKLAKECRLASGEGAPSRSLKEMCTLLDMAHGRRSQAKASKKRRPKASNTKAGTAPHSPMRAPEEFSLASLMSTITGGHHDQADTIFAH